MHQNISGQLNDALQEVLFYKGDIVVDNVDQWESNNIHFTMVGYFLKKEREITVKKIQEYYKHSFKRFGYKVYRKKDQKLAEGMLQEMYLMNDKHIFGITIYDLKDIEDYYITLQVSEKDVMRNPGMFLLNKKKDNPGFDYKDIPRFKNSIRFMSSRSISEVGKTEQQIIYHTLSEIEGITDFYKDIMIKEDWKMKQSFETPECNMLHYKKSKNNEVTCDIFIMKSKDMKENAIIINRSSYD